VVLWYTSISSFGMLCQEKKTGNPDWWTDFDLLVLLLWNILFGNFFFIFVSTRWLLLWYPSILLRGEKKVWKQSEREEESRVARFFLVQTYQNGKNIPKYTNGYNICMYTKWPWNIQNVHKIYQYFPFQDPPKYTHIRIFGMNINHLATLEKSEDLVFVCVAWGEQTNLWRNNVKDRF
jgi:hypothetical protein